MRFLFIMFMFCIDGRDIIAQNTVRIFAGLNSSILRVHYNEFNPKLDSSYLLNSYIFLPAVGVDIGFSITDKVSFCTGIGLSMVGSKDYNRDVLVANPDLNIDPNLRISLIKVPLSLQYDLSICKLDAGYSLNYSFRKNQNFLATNSSGLINIYSKYQHLIMLGVRKDWDLLSFTLKYQLWLNPISDTKEYYTNWSEKQTMNVFQITIGYLMTDEGN